MAHADYQTLPELLAFSARAYADLPALGSHVGGQWHSISYTELRDQCSRFAAGLIAMGVQPGQHVAVIAESSARWVICDFGIALAAAVNVAMFPSLPPGQIEYILKDSGARLILVGSPELLKKVLVVRETIPDLRIVLMNGEAEGEGVVGFDEVLAAGRGLSPATSPRSSTPAAPPASRRGSCSPTTTSCPTSNSATECCTSSGGMCCCRCCP